MNITGIITEYNPFHKGHKLHLEKSKNDTNSDGVICIMSGNFMQRGGPAIIDKWNRAKIAVLNGVDLVIELPLIYSLASAETFAFGAVKILNDINVVNSLYFGSECGDVSSLKKLALNLAFENDLYKSNLKEELNSGLPFHKARENALKNIDDLKDLTHLLNNSNNILGIEYIKALYKLNSNIKPVTLKRTGSNYNDTSLSLEGLSSATSIRSTIKEKGSLIEIQDSLTDVSFKFFNTLISENYNFTFDDSMFDYIKYKLLTSNESFDTISDLSEGLQNKILKEIINSKSYYDFIMNIKSKRYTFTRINRILTSIYIGLNRYDVAKIRNDFKPYIRVLAFNKCGAKILKEIKNNSDVEIITKVPKNFHNESLRLDLLGTSAYSILNKSISPNEDYLKSPFVI